LCRERIQKLSNLTSLLSLKNAFLTNKNIFTDVKDFEPNGNHSPNFLRVMQWLKESVQMQQCSHIDELETQLQMTLDTNVLILKALITKESCIMTDVRKWARA